MSEKKKFFHQSKAWKQLFKLARDHSKVSSDIFYQVMMIAYQKFLNLKEPQENVVNEEGEDNAFVLALAEFFLKIYLDINQFSGELIASHADYQKYFEQNKLTDLLFHRLLADRTYKIARWFHGARWATMETGHGLAAPVYAVQALGGALLDPVGTAKGIYGFFQHPGDSLYQVGTGLLESIQNHPIRFLTGQAANVGLGIGMARLATVAGPMTHSAQSLHAAGAPTLSSHGFHAVRPPFVGGIPMSHATFVTPHAATAGGAMGAGARAGLTVGLMARENGIDIPRLEQAEDEQAEEAQLPELELKIPSYSEIVGLYETLAEEGPLDYEDLEILFRGEAPVNAMRLSR